MFFSSHHLPIFQPLLKYLIKWIVKTVSPLNILRNYSEYLKHCSFLLGDVLGIRTMITAWVTRKTIPGWSTQRRRHCGTRVDLELASGRRTFLPGLFDACAEAAARVLRSVPELFPCRSWKQDCGISAMIFFCNLEIRSTHGECTSNLKV